MAPAKHTNSKVKIQSPLMAGLLREISFLPRSQKNTQLHNAQQLISIINDSQIYPFDFVCFKITGYHRKESETSALIKGYILKEDLFEFVRHLSYQLSENVDSLQEKVYSISQLAEEFSVSTKTIHRWRQKGLVAREFIFEDGKRRIGFLESNIVEFKENHSDLIYNASQFTQLSTKEKDRVIELAKKYVEDVSLTRKQIINKIASKLNRAVETIRYILQNYEKNQGDKIFQRSFNVISSKESLLIYELYSHGKSIQDLMQRFSRARSSIYRIINQQRVKLILKRTMDFIPSNEFSDENAESTLLVNLPPITKHDIASTATDIDSLPQYLQSIQDLPLLKRDLEMQYFRQYNFLKYKICQTRQNVDDTKISSKNIKYIEKLYVQADNLRKILIEASLSLVVNIASKHVRSGVHFADLISEGNFAMIRAVEKFDYTRGFRFATYASWAISKAFARSIPLESQRPDRSGDVDIESIEQDMRKDYLAGFSAHESVKHSLENVIDQNLDDREKYIVTNHFGLTGSLVRKRGKSMKQIGQELGISKERVRQIELRALQKLRHSLSPEEFELLTH